MRMKTKEGNLDLIRVPGSSEDVQRHLVELSWNHYSDPEGFEVLDELALIEVSSGYPEWIG